MPLVEGRDRLMHSFVEPCLKLPVEFFGAHAEILLDHLAGAHQVRVGMHHVEQLMRAPQRLWM